MGLTSDVLGFDSRQGQECFPCVYMDISFFTLSKTPCLEATKAQEMKVRLLLFVRQDLCFYRHFLMYAGRPIQTGGCRNATTFRDEFEFVSNLQIVTKCATEIACASI
jgi:hypothetical protein